jgi:single-strand DNA-binding protein
MASFNRVILLGNVTRDIEVKHLQSGVAVTEVGLAVNDRRKDDSGSWIEETTFVDVTLWGRTAEIASEYLVKGAPVLIEGRLKLDSWEKDGKKNYKMRVIGEKMQMIPTGRRGDASSQDGPTDDEYSQVPQSRGKAQPKREKVAAAAPPPSDDIPF